METEEKKNKEVHHGRNIRLARLLKDIKQEELAKKMHLTSEEVTRHEGTEEIDDKLLNQFAKALDVPIEFLKTIEDSSKTIVFESITNNDNAGANANMGYADTRNDRATYQNPLDKVTELYERLLKEKDDKYVTLEKRVQNLEKLLSDR